MSIRYSLLALLERGPMYGYQLRTAFEESTGANWPLNIGQVYSTLARLERDGLVRPLPEGEGGQRPYRITEVGRARLVGWFAAAVGRTERPRDEVTIKIALAVTTPGVDVASVVRVQRAATMGSLREYTHLHNGDPDPPGPARRLVLDALIFQAEAEIRWLDHCEATLVRDPPGTAAA